VSWLGWDRHDPSYVALCGWTRRRAESDRKPNGKM
jgi:hypothetical protein